MPRSTASSPKVKWNISVPADFDESTRLFLASQGGKKGALSSLVQKAVARYILSVITAEAKKKVRRSGISQKELDKIIAGGISWVKENPHESCS